jgi:hypothetical protein
VNDNTTGLDQIGFPRSIDTLVCPLALKRKQTASGVARCAALATEEALADED